MYDYGWEAVNPIAVVLLGVVKIFYAELGKWAFFLILVSLGLYIPSIIKIIKNKKRSSELEKSIEKLTQEKEAFENSILKYQEGFVNFFNSYLALIFNKLELSDDERISIYHHQKDHFSLLCRYSTNPKFIKKGRPTYPDNQGFIGIGYQKGFLHINNLPNPDNQLDRYTEEVSRQCEIKDDVLRNLSMKSRSYSVYAIEHPIKKNRLAVVVFESNKYNFDKCSEINVLLSELAEQVVSYIYYSDDIRPELSFAKQQGL